MREISWKITTIGSLVQNAPFTKDLNHFRLLKLNTTCPELFIIDDENNTNEGESKLHLWSIAAKDYFSRPPY